MRSSGKWLSVVTLVAAVVSCPLISCPLAQADDPSEVIEDVSVGFANLYKVGYWTPVWITLQADAATPLDGRLSISTPDGDGAVVQYRDETTVRVPAGESKTFMRRVKFGRLRPSLEIEFTTGAGVVHHRLISSAELAECMLTDSELLVTIGDAIGEEQWVSGQITSPTAVRRCQFQSADRLPADWLAYEGVDIIVLSTADNRVLAEMSAEQLAAIRQWVRMGGRLVLTMGANGKQVFASEVGSNLQKLADFVPGDFVDVGLLSSVVPLESYAALNHPLEIPDDQRLRVTVIKNVEGIVELSDTGTLGIQPLIVQSAYGFGRVTFVGLDLNLDPLASWEGRSQTVARLLGRGATATDEAASRQSGGRVAHVGFTDIAGQLRSALDQFSGISLVPFYWVAGLVFFYTLLIGPGDFFFLQRILRRMQLTWITFPLIVVAFSLAAIFLHGELKDDSVHVNQLDLIDIDLTTSAIRGSTWADIYSPRTDTYDLQWTSGPDVLSLMAGSGQTTASWQGLPGGGLGGLSASTAMPSFRATYVITEANGAARILDTPIQAAATKALQLRWWSETDLSFANQLQEDSNRLLRGQIENPLPFELTDCSILFGQWLYRLPDRMSGKLGAGAVVRIDSEKPRNLEYVLTRQRRVEDSREVTTPWDQSDLEVPRILQMMMFHDAAGGESYTQLRHRYQAFLDLSQQLLRGRAILVGRRAGSAMEVEIDNDRAEDAYDRSWTFYRIIFPVKQTGNP